ncbi:hypothetical protein PPS11_37100, partial [Pseudomonas putida S11]
TGQYANIREQFNVPPGVHS